eukprot:SAG22_NODE_1379_length_4547_cov_8.497752_2_plen_124_part_00
MLVNQNQNQVNQKQNQKVMKSMNTHLLHNMLILGPASRSFRLHVRDPMRALNATAQTGTRTTAGRMDLAAELAEFKKEQEAEFAASQEKMKKQQEEKAAAAGAGAGECSPPICMILTTLLGTI